MLRTPYLNLISKNVTSTLSSVATYTLPDTDFNSLHCKLIVGTLLAGSATNNLNVYVQTTDDGGTTWYDCVAFGTATGVIANANALQAEIPVSVGSATYIANAQATATSSYVGGVSGIPLLSNMVRVCWRYSTMTSTALADWTFTASLNNQSSYS